MDTGLIPNIIHFVFGLKEQTDDFLFCYYLAIYSAFKVNNPDKIYFYYHYMPKGKWWDKLLEIPNLVLEKVDVPTHIGKKEIKFLAHKADKVRMDILYERGGIYMDIDTLSIRPYKHLLNNNVVLGKQRPFQGICNAIMFTKPKSEFFKIWLDKYEDKFKSNGWNESSIVLPFTLSKEYPHLLKVLEPEAFFIPSYTETSKIFTGNHDISKELITLHLWEKASIKYIEKINDWDWSNQNSNTLYGKMMNTIKKEYYE